MGKEEGSVRGRARGRGDEAGREIWESMGKGSG